MVKNILNNQNKGNPEVLKILIELGADINAVDNERKTPLMHAAIDGNFSK